MKVGPNSPCPCWSGRKYKKCCRLYHKGEHPDTVERLMRSRFSAYALGLADYVIETTDPEGEHWEQDRVAWRAQIQSFCESMSFNGLVIHDAGQREDRGIVAFTADLRQGERAAPMHERSLFVRRAGRWLYVGGLREG